MLAANEIAATTIRRGAEIFGFGLLFRLQEFVLGAAVGALDGFAARGRAEHDWDFDDLDGRGVLAGDRRGRRTRFWPRRWRLGIALATPPLWTTWRPHWLPWFLESYVNGVHNLGVPQAWLFPIFPWTAFAFAGLAVGFPLFSEWAKANLAKTTAICGAGGRRDCIICRYGLMGGRGIFTAFTIFGIRARISFWRAWEFCSMIIFLSYAWCRWGAGQWGFSPIIALGQNSLVVYWVHIEFVYGRFSILTKRAQSIPMASLGLW